MGRHALDTTRILGIDPGFGRTGYGMITQEKGSSSCGVFGCIETTASLPFSDRLLEIYERISSLIANEKPAIISLEKLFFGKNTKTALDVSQARGVILLAVRHARVPCLEYTPLQVKQSITGNGVADKQQVQHMVMRLLHLSIPPKPDDAADALALALCAAQHLPFLARIK